MLAMAGLTSMWMSYIASLALALTALFMLGVYLGRVAQENVLLYGIQMLAAGVVIAVIVFILGGA